jgi:hypothetical protein
MDRVLLQESTLSPLFDKRKLEKNNLKKWQKKKKKLLSLSRLSLSTDSQSKETAAAPP